MDVILYIHKDNTNTVHVGLNVIELNNAPIQLECQRGLQVDEWRGSLESEPKAVKVNNGTLRGEVLNEGV